MSKAKKMQKEKREEYNKRMRELNQIRSQLQSAYSVFNNTTDESLLDACIFEISALNARYNCAVKNIRNME